MGAIPFSFVPLLLYWLAALFLYNDANYVVTPGEVALHPFWDEAFLSVTLVSGRFWALTNGDAMIVLALFMLLVSLLRSASTRESTVLGNMVMVIVLVVYVVVFLTFGFAGTSLFFILTVIALIDTLATVSISMVASHSRMDAVPD